MTDANRDQVEYWNGEVGQRWAQNQRILDTVFAPLTEALFAAASLPKGASVLDIGCGAGQTALIAARRIGPQGRVTAADVSAPLLAIARERALHEPPGSAPIDWIEADAQSHDFGAGRFGQALSRFGVMFFSDSIAAFANLRRALAPKGRLTFLCWRGVAENAWVAVPRTVALRLVPDFEPPPPDSPGPFRFADRDGLLAILKAAGFARVVCDPLDRTVTLGAGDTPEDAAAAAAAFAVGLGPVARLLRDREPAVQQAACEAVAQTLAPLAADGRVALGAGCWLVSAA